MSRRLDFRILGPLEVRDGSEVLRLGGPRQRSLLAVLLLHADEVVSSDRLLEAVWGDAAPVPGALHAQISRLRKVLEPDHDGDPVVLATRPPGYVLRVDPEQVDLGRFEALVERAREARPPEASRLLREALALWRGRPLADLEGEPFQRDAVARLDDARLAAIEARVEADLACGRHGDLVAELRDLVREHPFRERLRGQLMLALYRGGRQGEALDVYADGRRVLAAELGLEPGPALRRLQEQILAQDAALDADVAPPPPAALDADAAPAPAATAAADGAPAPPAATGPRRRRLPVALVAAGMAALVTAGVVLATGGDDDGARAGRSAGGSVAVLGSAGGVEHRVTVGSTPSALAVGEGATWAVDADEQTVSRIDDRTREVTTFATGSTPTDVAVGQGSVWVGGGTRSDRGQASGAVASVVARVDPASRTVRARISLPSPSRARAHGTDGRVAVGAGAVWAITADGAVARIDPRTDQVTGLVRGLQASDVAAGTEGVWVLGDRGAVAHLDTRRMRYDQRLQLDAPAVAGLAVGGGAVWVTAPGDGRLWRIEPGRKLTARAIPVGAGVGDVAYGEEGVWITNGLRGTVVRVDPVRQGVVAEAGVGGTPRAVVVNAGTVLVASSGDMAPVASSAGGVRAARCGPVVTGGGGAPDRLVVADLPFQGGIRLSAQQVEQAMLHTLRERGFRAGRFRLGFQSCDDSIGRTGIFDQAKCAENARAYARTAAVVGVLGYINTPCAAAALPVLNRAGPAPLAALSALASSPALTRAVPGAPPDELERLYPTGTRNFLRVYPADDYQAVALARLARDDGARAVAVLDDGSPEYGRLLADRFEAAADELDLDVVARVTWDPQADSFDRLARRVAAQQPDAVFVGGLLDTQGAEVLRALRRHLGPGPLRLVPDGFTPTRFFARRAGVAAEGAYLSVSGVLPEGLPAAGRRFVRRFAPTQPGAEVEPSAIYAAESMAVMLGAIARSDGTRASVLRELFATRRRGLLGPVTFDGNGDVRVAPVTILRIKRGERSIEVFDDAALDRVIG